MIAIIALRTRAAYRDEHRPRGVVSVAEVLRDLVRDVAFWVQRLGLLVEREPVVRVEAP